jgi:hypothetical protein
MKRVLLLVILIVSLVELDLERYRIYMFFAIADFALLLCYPLMQRRSVRKAAAIQTVDSGTGVSASLSEVRLASGLHHS